MCKSNVQERKKQHESSVDELYVGSVGTTHAMSKNEWHADVNLEDKTLTVQLDTGARCNVISIKDLQRLGININVKKPEAQLRSYSGHVIATKGVTTLPCEYKRKIYPVKFHVVDIPAPAVFSANTCKEMGLVQRVFAVETSKSNYGRPLPPKIQRM